MACQKHHHGLVLQFLGTQTLIWRLRITRQPQHGEQVIAFTAGVGLWCVNVLCDEFVQGVNGITRTAHTGQGHPNGPCERLEKLGVPKVAQGLNGLCNWAC
jgi:hypothetical protein